MTISAAAAKKLLKEYPRYITSRNSLNLVLSVEENIKFVIQGIPEIKSAFTNEVTSKVEQLEQLERGVQVLENVMKGSKEHQASLNVLADYQNIFGRYKEASKTIRDIRGYLSDTNQFSTIGRTLVLTQAKAEWNNGNFQESLRLCKESFLADHSNDNDNEILNDRLLKHCSLNGMALSELMLYLSAIEHDPDNISTEKEESIIDLFSNSTSILEGKDHNKEEIICDKKVTLCTSVSELNKVIAKSAMKYHHLSENQSPPQHLSSNNNLKDTIESLKSKETLFSSSPYYNILYQSQLASLYSSIAYQNLYPNGTILSTSAASLLDVNDVLLKEASQLCQEALAINKNINNEYPDKVCAKIERLLFLLASCYTKTSSFITAEGLLKSSVESIDLTSQYHPMDLLSVRDAYYAYANLCAHWDKREGEAELFKKSAIEIEEKSLVETWRYMPGILCDLWFITNSDLYP